MLALSCGDGSAPPLWHRSQSCCELACCCSCIGKPPANPGSGNGGTNAGRGWTRTPADEGHLAGTMRAAKLRPYVHRGCRSHRRHRCCWCSASRAAATAAGARACARAAAVCRAAIPTLLRVRRNGHQPLLRALPPLLPPVAACAACYCCCCLFAALLKEAEEAVVAACAMRVVAEAPRGLRPVLLLLRADAVVQSPRPTRRIGCCRPQHVAPSMSRRRRRRAPAAARASAAVPSAAARAARSRPSTQQRRSRQRRRRLLRRAKAHASRHVARRRRLAALLARADVLKPLA